MNTSSTILTAMLRSFYLALLAGALTGLGILQQSDDNRTAVIAGAIAALTVLAGRGLGEGVYDANRQTNGDVSSSDVQPGNQGKA